MERYRFKTGFLIFVCLALCVLCACGTVAEKPLTEDSSETTETSKDETTTKSETESMTEATETSAKETQPVGLEAGNVPFATEELMLASRPEVCKIGNSSVVLYESQPSFFDGCVVRWARIVSNGNYAYLTARGIEQADFIAAVEVLAK